MHRFYSRFLCTLLSIAFVLQGCQNITFKYHRKGGDLSALKVYPYWEGRDGEKYVVGGLKVTLYPRYEVEEDRFVAGKIIEEVTNTESPLYFDDLEPGSYRLRVFLNERAHVSEKLDLKPGKRLTVRIDVAGVEKTQNFSDTIEEIGETIGEAMVVIGTLSILIAVKALEIYLTGDSDD